MFCYNCVTIWDEPVGGFVNNKEVHVMKEELEQGIVAQIASGNRTKSGITQALNGMPAGAIDNALERMRKRGEIRFVKGEGWLLCRDDVASPTEPAQEPSAPVPDSNGTLGTATGTDGAGEQEEETKGTA